MKVQKKISGKKFGLFIGIVGLAFGIFILNKSFNQNSNFITQDQYKYILNSGYVKKIIVNAKDEVVLLNVDKAILKEKEYKDYNSSFALYFTYYTKNLETVVNELIINKSYQQKKIPIIFQSNNTYTWWIISSVLSLLMIYYFFTFYSKRKKSKPSTPFHIINKSNIDFNDIAGLEDVKKELREIIEFLKHSSKYNNLGAKIPKGVLLSGDPGTGKTLLAKAVAGEANVSFIPISGADFVEVFVGVGSSRVRDLFKIAKQNAPCIIFIDEIDAIGRSRNYGNFNFSGSQERENTLNSLLVEMDGFVGNEGVIIIGATNRPDILDEALTRSGRFDRIIVVNKPDFNNRKKIFSLHLQRIPLEENINLDKLCELTSGASGADIANICNEAALLAGRKKQNIVKMSNLFDAIERQLTGIHSSRILSDEEKKVVAIHESGHAICSYYLPHAQPLVKVSLMPKGMFGLGYSQYKKNNKILTTKNEIQDQICVSLGGRIAEEIIIGNITNAGAFDLDKATRLAQKMVLEYGMSEKIINRSFNSAFYNHSSGIIHADCTLELIDNEIKNIMQQCYEKTKELLCSKRDAISKLSEELLKKEVLSSKEVKDILETEEMEFKLNGVSSLH